MTLAQDPAATAQEAIALNHDIALSLHQWVRAIAKPEKITVELEPEVVRLLDRLLTAVTEALPAATAPRPARRAAPANRTLAH